MIIMVCRLRGNYAELSECCREGGACLGLLWDVSSPPRFSLCVCEDVSLWSLTLGIGVKSGRRIPNIYTFKEAFAFLGDSHLS